MTDLSKDSDEVIEMLIHALESSENSVTKSYVDALREVLRLRADCAKMQGVILGEQAENERLSQLLSGRDENLLSRETHDETKEQTDL